jgi:thiol-disulfide isomerase/thioredoxin
MGGKTAIATGLVTGIVAGGLVLGGILLLTPSPIVPVATDPPSTEAPSPSSSAVPSRPASAAPSAPPSASPASAAPSAAATPVPSASSGETGLFGVGEPAPDLRLPLVGGGEIDLAALRGKPVWVNFMATWCPSCVDELPSMAGFAARYEDTGLAVVVVDVREDEAAVKAFMDQVGVRFPVGLDADGGAQGAWGAFALPVHFWVDADGVVRDGALGGIGPDVMADGLQTILPGVEVTP